MIRPAHTIAMLLLSASAAWAQQTHEPATLQPKRYDGHKLVRVDLETFEDVKVMRSLDARQLSCHEGFGETNYVLSPEGLAELESRGVRFVVLDDDVQVTIEKQRARIDSANAAAAAGLSNWFEEYKDLPSIEAKQLELQAAHPDLITLHEIGRSIEDRPIWAMTITGPGDGANKPAVLFMGTQHAREWPSPMVNMYLADVLVSRYDTDPRIQALVDQIEILIVPVVNPDGYVFSWLPVSQGGDPYWRKNRRRIGGGLCDGVDLNRNWGAAWGLDDVGSSGDPCKETYRGTAAFSEPETAAVRNLILAHPNLVAHIDYHTNFQMILTPYGYTEVLPADHDEFMVLATMMKTAIGSVYQQDYAAGPLHSMITYSVNGAVNDWCYDELDFFSCTVEMRPGLDWMGVFAPDSEQLLPTCEENLAAALALMEAVVEPVTWIFPEGRQVQVPSGVTTTVTIEILADPTTIVSGSQRLLYRQGSLGPFTAVPLNARGGFDYEATLPALGAAGSSIDYYFAVDTTSGETRTSPNGAPATLYHAGVVEPFFDWAFDVDPGWSTEGDWAFGQPTGEGGYYFGELNFSYPDPTSGHTGPNVYGNNLEGDSTDYGAPISLVSEPIDCSLAENVELRFWRWLNVPTSVGYEDRAAVSVSNDGVTWHQVWGGRVEENVWSQEVLDISAVANRQPTVYLRWTLRSRGSAFTGWNIDDVEIWATPKIDTTCRGDLDFDGSVGFTDVTSLLGAWGPCPNCPQDLSGDGEVGFTDLTELLGDWGPCP